MAMLSTLPSPSSPSLFSSSSSSSGRTRNRSSNTKTFAARREGARNPDFRGRPVDENMIVLRKRIHESKMMEASRDEPPEDWMDWEKQIYPVYDSMICDAVGQLQSYLMETRPCVVLGMIALIALSVPTSTAILTFKFLELATAVLCGIHPSWS